MLDVGGVWVEEMRDRVSVKWVFRRGSRQVTSIRLGLEEADRGICSL